MASSSTLLSWRLLLCTFSISLVCHYTVLGSTINSTEMQKNLTFPENHSLVNGADLNSSMELDESDYEETEEEDLPLSESIVDESIRTQPVVKLGNTTKKGEKKNGTKKNRSGKKKGQNNKKKENLCETTHKEFCIHGTCRHFESLGKVSCRCQHNYIGERCSEMSMKTQSKGDLSDTSTTALAVVAVLLSTISFIAIAIVIVVHMRKKYSSAYEGETEEKKKLGHENRDIDV